MASTIRGTNWLGQIEALDMTLTFVRTKLLQPGEGALLCGGLLRGREHRGGRPAVALARMSAWSNARSGSAVKGHQRAAASSPAVGATRAGRVAV
ncbi:hypothetical protein [Streptomyces sennicomposti]